MRFAIQIHDKKDPHSIQLIDKESGTTVTVLPDYGALLHEVITVKNGVPHNYIDNYPDQPTLESELGRSYKSAKLSPFACRIRDAKYLLGDQEYEFSRKFMDGSAIHGIMFDKKFEVTGRFVNEKNASLTLTHKYKGNEPGYPFSYEIAVNYVLEPGNTVKVITTVTNRHEEDIPIADGWHPYFKLGGKADNWLLRFSSIRQVEFDDSLIPTGHFLEDERFKSSKTIGTTKLDNCFLLDDAITETPICEIVNPSNGHSVQFYADMGYPYLQIYIPDNRESIAIENLSAAPDCFNNGLGLIDLAPGDKETFQLRYKFGE